MALFLFLRFHLVFLLIGLLSSENGPLLPVNAAANVEIPGPELNIANPPPPEIILTQLNTPLLLPCTATVKNITVANRFDFEIQWSWHRNGKKLSVGKRSDFQLYDNGSLSLPFIEKASGIYRCIVNATEGIILSTQSVVKYASLKKISAQSNIQLMEGMHLVLNCPVISVPNANITWRFGNDPIETQFHRNRILQLENGTLIIKNISSKEKGKYKCTAENRYATKKDRRFNWNISVQPSSENFYKELLLPPLQDETQYIPSRSDFTLRCLGYTNVIEWFFVPRLNGKYPIKINNNSNEIIVRNANEEIHGGFYNCSTKKDFQVFEIKVTTPPQITESYKSYECTLAAPVSLKCNAKGNPPPEITWYRNGIKIENENTVYYTQPILRIHSFDLKDDGFYQCFARNVAGESSISGILKLRRKEYLDTLPRRPENVKCFPVNYTTLNVTFNSTSTLSFMSIHFVTENPYKWNSSLPIKLKSNSFLIISQGLPILKPFSLYMRGLVQTSTQITFEGNMEHTFDTSLLTDAIKCATQGLIVNGVFFPNGIFIWWHHNFVSAKYFIVQFWNNETTNPVFDSTIIGTTHPINLYYTRSNIERQLYKIPVIQQANTASQLINGRDILRNEQADDKKTLLGAITNVIIPGNVTGILIPNTTRVTVRVLVITEENEDLTQDLSYVQWKTIENTTTHNFLFKVSNVESRTIMLMWNPVESVSCIKACYYNAIKAAIRDDLEKFCQDINVSSSVYFTVRKLKPLTPYRMDFMDCKTMQFFGSTDVQTKSDPPGSIRNHNISNSNGLKLSWDPPLNTNGDIMYYVIWWTINNFTNEANVTDSENSFKFPNVTENDKINVTIRVVGRNGIGPPVFIDLRNIESEILEKDKHFSVDPTLGIILGVLLSLICICVFIYLFIRQRKRFKSRINRSQHDEQNLPAAMTPSIELHEMQTLIPKYSTPFSVVNDCEEQLPQQPQQPRTLPNGNGVQHNHDNSTEIQQSDNEELSDIPIALCSSTPLAGRRKDLSEILYDENSPKLNVITPANTDNIQLNKISSSPNFFNSSKAISNKNATQLQNGYIKTLLPPLKHSISTVSSSEPKLLLLNGGCKLPENSKCKINTNSNTSTTDNSQLKLLGTNLDRNKKHKNYRNSCDETINSENNDTATTMINMDDTIQGYRDPVHPTNWNYRRPIIDPNG